MIAANSVLSGVSRVPPPCGRTLDGGTNGFAISPTRPEQCNSTYPAPCRVQRRLTT